MTDSTRALLRTHLKQAEGLRLKPYHDTTGHLTIGYGRNLDANGISPSEAEFLLEHDISGVIEQVRRYLPWVDTLDEIRQAAVMELAFNLGLAGLLKFGRTLVALHEGRYADASQHLLASKWAGQVGSTRSGRIARMLEKGEA